MDSYQYGHLIPRQLAKKDVYLGATHSIQDSFTGILDLIPLHRIFIESSIELRNGIKQYEEGFIGSAFYSIRTAVELARIVAFFSTIDSPIHSEIYSTWTSGGKFPFDSAVKKKVEEASDVFAQVKAATGTFFDDQANNLKQYQKYIHKQGYRPFYERGFTSEDAATARLKRIDTDFEHFLRTSIVEIALLRLCIDPFPLLLNDPAVMKRVHVEMMTYPYSDDLLNLMGDAVEEYRNTDYYKDHTLYFSENEELSDEAMILINDSYYSREFKDIIEPQLHLLSVLDRAPVLLFNASPKIAKVYAVGGFEQIFSDVKTPRQKHSWSSEMFTDAVGNNRDFDEAYLSYIKLFDQEFWVEHIEKFTSKELEELALLAAKKE